MREVQVSVQIHDMPSELTYQGVETGRNNTVDKAMQDGRQREGTEKREHAHSGAQAPGI